MTASAFTRFADRPGARAIFSNPVVVRDLRAQMRGSRSYWYMGAYLLLLGILSIAGYALSTHQGLNAGSDGTQVSIIDAQSQLSGLYQFIFMTIAALICLIAPALTASSIVGERQRLSFDLLVTTPLKAHELLIGKLLSSVAFLGMLLMLSLPASALCVILGAATFGDVLRTYYLLALSGVVMAGIGLFFSCAVRTSLLALIWTYASVVAFLGLTFLIGEGARTSSSMNNTLPLAGAVGLLNPFSSVMSATFTGIRVHGNFTLSCALGATIAAGLILWLLINASAYRLGSYGGSYGSRLRVLAFLLLGVGSYMFADLIYPTLRSEYLSLAVGSFIVISPFLPALFVPASREDAPPGTPEETSVSGGRLGAYRITAAFRPYHAGALPYYHLLILSMTIGLCAAIVVQGGASVVTDNVWEIGLGAGYLAAVGFLFWTVSRWAATLARAVSGARALSYGAMIFIAVLPLLVSVLVQDRTLSDEISRWSILSPIDTRGADYWDRALPAFAQCAVLGVFFALLARLCARRRR